MYQLLNNIVIDFGILSTIIIFCLFRFNINISTQLLLIVFKMNGVNFFLLKKTLLVPLRYLQIDNDYLYIEILHLRSGY